MTNQGPLTGDRETIAIALRVLDTPRVARDLLTTGEILLNHTVTRYQATQLIAWGYPVLVTDRSGHRSLALRVKGSRITTSQGKKDAKDIITWATDWASQARVTGELRGFEADY